MDKNFSDWWSEMKRIRWRLVTSLFLIGMAMLSFYASGDYVTDKGGVVASDLILDNIGPYNLSFIYVWVFLGVLAVGLFYPLIFRTKELPFVLNMTSLFVIIRSGFIIFTHLKVPHDAIVTSFPIIFQFLNFSNDLFFSGHAGLPFLGFLVFRKENKMVAYFMLISSFVLAATVLLMHIHYSIDVFSAYFISYGIYRFGNRYMRFNR